MSHILVSGLINIETTLQVDGFPIPYFPVRYPFFGINSTVSGVGLNVTKALTVLGDTVDFISMIGNDQPALLVENELARDGISNRYVLRSLSATPQSVIAFEHGGRRQIHVDLKDVQDAAYPVDTFLEALELADLAVLCNVNFSRPLLHPTKQAGVTIATDVHVISDLENGYDDDFMASADILFMSDENLPVSPEVWARQVIERYGNRIVIIGLGDKGALLAVPADNYMERIPAVNTRAVVNTIGAGDALFSAFVHVYAKTEDPYAAIRKAMVFASHKIGAISAAEGFLTGSELELLSERIYTGGKL